MIDKLRGLFIKKETSLTQKSIQLDVKLITLIDSLLKDLLEKGDINNYNSNTILICENLRLIKHTGVGKYLLEDKGVTAIEDGGLENYLENIRIEKLRDNAIKRLTRRSLKYDVMWNIGFIILGALLSLGSVMFLGDNTQNNELLEIEKLRKQENAIIDKHDNFETYLQQMRSEITSLKNEIDSLKNSK
ncbi:hypothetical protein [Mariniflexile sp. AS56]|uniref:hypothetical protein n=1 Tax=Mariniflexile sp. AS56 TaxID=3063957 RepID=UPI0026E92DA9|nr:hypothetical protein [Mariniflexile sp. AS56]MDO7174256.1 hypothetical protein [Mariniflexile sp. AS56]